MSELPLECQLHGCSSGTEHGPTCPEFAVDEADKTMKGRMSAPVKDNQRLLDLVRYCRSELHEADLITDAEYAEISGWGAQSARRLEDYDLLRRRVILLTSALKAHIGYFGGGSHRFDECPTPGECEECKVNALATVALGEKI